MNKFSYFFLITQFFTPFLTTTIKTYLNEFYFHHTKTVCIHFSRTDRKPNHFRASSTSSQRSIEITSQAANAPSYRPAFDQKHKNRPEIAVLNEDFYLSEPAPPEATTRTSYDTPRSKRTSSHGADRPHVVGSFPRAVWFIWLACISNSMGHHDDGGLRPEDGQLSEEESASAWDWCKEKVCGSLVCSLCVRLCDVSGDAKVRCLMEGFGFFYECLKIFVNWEYFGIMTNKLSYLWLSIKKNYQ